MSEHVVTGFKDGVLTLKFDRADKKNALTTAMYAAAAAALQAAADDNLVRVLLLTGSGDSFTAGNDLKDFLANPANGPDAPVFKFMRALAAFQKPVVAAVNGVAVGIGTTLLLHCDLGYAATDAKFQLPFVNLAVVPEFASSLLLPTLVGHARAAELILLGEPFGAQQAMEMGLVNAVVQPENVMMVAAAKAAALAAKPPAALRAAKALLRGNAAEVAARIDKESKAFATCLGSPEFKEAATAFLEKRAPDFSKFK